MGCLGTQTGRGQKRGEREKKENKQTNEQWGSQDRDAATGKTEQAEARMRRTNRHSEDDNCWSSHDRNMSSDKSCICYSTTNENTLI